MATFIPFTATRPAAEAAARIACLPYDVMDRAEAAEMGRAEPGSFIHVIRSEIDLPDTTDCYAPAVYERAAENFEKMQSDGLMFTEEAPAYYLYEQTFMGKTQSGFVGLAPVDEYENNTIKKHEHTLPEKETDRINHFTACRAQTEPVFFMHRQREELKKITEQIKKASSPVYDFTAANNVTNRLYVIKDGETIEKIKNEFALSESLYIADGHHRTASVCRVRDKLSAKGAPLGGADYIMAVTFPEDEVNVMDYNRLLTDIGEYDAEGLIIRLGEDFVVNKFAEGFKADTLHVFAMYISGDWYSLTAKPHCYEHSDPIGHADATILQKYFFDRLLNITDPTKSDRLSFVGGIRGYSFLKEKVDSGSYACAVALCPVRPSDIMEVADNNLIMPPKSTWFEPKLFSGMFIHKF